MYFIKYVLLFVIFCVVGHFWNGRPAPGWENLYLLADISIGFVSLIPVAVGDVIMGAMHVIQKAMIKKE